jgi:protease YdgD
MPRRFLPPWSIEQTHACFTGRDESGQALRRRASFGCRAILASVLILATPVLAVGSQPQREIVDVQRFPWSSIGKVSSAGEHCTGTVIGADRFLTAAHCLYLTRTGHFLLPESINILLGYTIPPAFDASLYAYPPKRTNYLIGARNDWAVVYTDESFPLDIKPLRLASIKPSPGIAVKMAGYPAESLYAMTADPHCQITEISHDGKLIAQNCITHSGDSGVLTTTV